MNNAQGQPEATEYTNWQDIHCIIASLVRGRANPIGVLKVPRWLRTLEYPVMGGFRVQGGGGGRSASPSTLTEEP